MEFCLRLALLLLLVIGTLTQDGFDLSDALDDLPKEKPKVTEKPKTDDTKPKPDKPADTPPKTSGGGDFGFDLGDALDTDTNPKPDKPADKPKPPKTSGGDSGTFSDSDLFDVRDGDYKPDGGRSGGGRAVDPDPQGGADQPQDPWGQILKMLNANMPEEFHMWMSNLKQILRPLLERAMDLLQAVP
ncbi:CD99 molecule isoform X2 [Toxotes jaculatrix]|uniref:CD99 molecule isoform X2 n=1 Tax=Toxotes jaculatrix TaxID=941984 RepID=UPI001B3B0AA3|nr:CD99 molecule isoform X2 [Toxotes jaculatrix]